MARTRTISILALLSLAGCQTAAAPDPGAALTLESSYRLIVNCFTDARPGALVDRRVLRTGYAVTDVTLDPDTAAAYRVTFNEVPVYRIAITGQALGASASQARWNGEVLPALTSCNERAKRGDI